MKRSFPTLIVFGGMRCGTTSLFRYLSAHPDVYSSTKKELDIFYHSLDDPSSLIEEKYNDAYASYMGKESVLLEASPRYARKYKEIAKKISTVIPDVKIIYLIRNPVERMLSVYKSIVRSGALNEGVSFDQFVFSVRNLDETIFADKKRAEGIFRELELGLYAPIINTLIDLFGEGQVFVECLENLAINPQDCMNRACEFIGIEGSFYNEFSFSIENPSVNVKWPQLYKTALDINSKLEPLLNRFPKVRSLIRDFHHAFNKSSRRDEMSEASLLMLNEYYSKDNIEVCDLVVRLGVRSIPDWLGKNG